MKEVKLYPLLFEPVFKEKLWGGRKLEKILNKKLPPEISIGESWEISDHPDGPSIIANGHFKNMTLSELKNMLGKTLMGNKYVERYHDKRFPLLVKFIDSEDLLSVQVHPDDEYTKKNNLLDSGKTEAWYVIWADNDAFLYKGFNKTLSKEEFVKALSEKKLSRYLNKVPVKTGDIIFLPPGTVHAIGKGIIICEVQQSSNITYRIYDWDRVDKNGKPRELHLKEALEVMNLSKELKGKEEKKLLSEKKEYKKYLLIKNNYFIMQELVIFETTSFKFSPDYFKMMMIIEGNGNFLYDNEKLPYEKGNSFLIPAYLKELTLVPSQNTKIVYVENR